MISCLTFEMSRTTSSERPSKMSSSRRRACCRSCAGSGSSSRRSRRRSCRAASRSPWTEGLSALVGAAAALEEVLDRRKRRVRQRDQEVRADEDVQLARVQPPDRLVEDREVENDEEVVLVLVDLRPLIARQDVLVVERVELEVLLEPGAIDGPGPLDVDPAEAVTSTVSTFGSRLVAGRRRPARARASSLGFGRLGIGTERVVGDRHRNLILLPMAETSCILRASHTPLHREGWRDMALRNPGNHPTRNGANSIEM